MIMIMICRTLLQAKTYEVMSDTISISPCSALINIEILKFYSHKIFITWSVLYDCFDKN